MSKMFTRRSNKDRASPNNTILADTATIIDILDDITPEKIDAFDERIRNFTYPELIGNIEHYRASKRALEKTAQETKEKELKDKIKNDVSLVKVALDHLNDAKRIRDRMSRRVAPAPSGGRSRRPRRPRKTRRPRRPRKTRRSRTRRLTH
jgi:predicted metal-dependent hydrolase